MASLLPSIRWQDHFVFAVRAPDLLCRCVFMAMGGFLLRLLYSSPEWARVHDSVQLPAIRKVRSGISAALCNDTSWKTSLIPLQQMGVVVLHPSTHRNSAQPLPRLSFAVALAKAWRIDVLGAFPVPLVQGGYGEESLTQKRGNITVELSAVEWWWLTFHD